MVGQGEGIEAEPLGLVDEVADPAEAVEERELRVDVEMREVIARQELHERSTHGRARLDTGSRVAEKAHRGAGAEPDGRAP